MDSGPYYIGDRKIAKGRQNTFAHLPSEAFDSGRGLELLRKYQQNVDFQTAQECLSHPSRTWLVPLHRGMRLALEAPSDLHLARLFGQATVTGS